MSLITVDYGAVGGENTEKFVLSSALAMNDYVDFTVKSSNYKAIGIRGNRADDAVRFSYFNSDTFTNGVFGYTSNSSTQGAIFITDSSMITFPNATTMRFTNTQVGSGGMKAGTEIFLIH